MVEFLLFIIIVLLVIVLISSMSNKAANNEKINRIDKKINYLVKEIRNLKSQEAFIKAEKKEEAKTEEKPLQKNQVKESTQNKEKKISAQQSVSKEERLEKELEELAKKEKLRPLDKNASGSYTTIKKENPTNKKPDLQDKSKASFEQKIGENWLNKIGIIILVLGIGYSVKYAIDKHWINEVGRVILGLLSGFILLGIAYYLRKSYRAFSSVLAGGAFGTFYYTITIAYQYYGMFNQQAAFGIMLVITTFSAILALKYDRVELAAISLTGGFTSTFMVAGEENNYIAFFTYITILNVGMLAMSYFKRWDLIKFLSVLFTSILFLGWYFKIIFWEEEHLKEAILIPMGITFASICYFIFYAAAVIYNVRKKEKFKGLQLASLITISLVYLSSGIILLSYIDNGKWQGIFTLGLAILNLVIGIAIKTNKAIDKNLYFVLLGKVITLGTLFPLIQFEGYTITSFWVVEVAVLVWLFQKTKIDLFKSLSVIVFLFSATSLIINWLIHYSHQINTPFFNKGFLTFSISLVSLVFANFLLKKEKQDESFLIFNAKSYRVVLSIWIGFISYIFLLLELNEAALYYGKEVNDEQIKTLLIFGYHFVVGLVITYINRKSKNELLQTFLLIGLILTLILYFTVGNIQNIEIRNASITGGLSPFWFYLHFVVMVLAFLCLWFYFRCFLRIKNVVVNKNLFYVAVSLLAIWALTIELDHIAVKAFSTSPSNWSILGYEQAKIIGITQKAGYTVLWGTFSFILMYLGMKSKIQSLRLIALIVFFVTIIKLLVFDLYNISELGRIIVFITLGIILLVVSFMYQRLKKLILEGE